MAKGQQRSNRETKKPKANKPGAGAKGGSGVTNLMAKGTVDSTSQKMK